MEIVPIDKNDTSEPTTARCVAYWTEASPSGGVEGRILFDPWTPLNGSYVVHDHRHTERVPHIHANHLAGVLSHGVMPDLSGGAVFLLGRGASLALNAEALASRHSPAIYMNHAALSDHPKPGDFVMMIDPNTIAMPGRKDMSLICTPAIPTDVISSGWGKVYGANMREPAPINDWAKSLFPNLPEVAECLSVNVSAIHYAALCGAKAVICCGMDFCTSQPNPDAPTAIFGGVKSLDGSEVYSEMHYLHVAMASAFMGMLAKSHTGMRIINVSGRGLFGMNVHKNDGALFDWVEQMDILDALRELD